MKKILILLITLCVHLSGMAQNGYSLVPSAGSGTVYYKQCQVIDKLQTSTADEGDLIRLNGRLKSTLTPAQEAVATACGYITNLFDGTGKVLLGSGTGFTPLANGGSATSILTQANLPNVNLTGGNHGHNITDSGHSHATNINNATFNGSANGGERFLNNGGSTLNSNITSGFGSTASTTGVTINASGNLTIPLGGSGTAISTQNPYGVSVKYVYLGPANPVVTVTQPLSLTNSGSGPVTFNAGTGVINAPFVTGKILILNTGALSGVLNGVNFTTAWADPISITTSSAMTGFISSDVVTQANGVQIDAWLNGIAGGAGGRIQRWKNVQAGTSITFGIYNSAYSCEFHGFVTIGAFEYKISGYTHGGVLNKMYIELMQ